MSKPKVIRGTKGAKAPFGDLSDLVCDARGCGRRIKKNVAVRKETRPLLCYRCFGPGEYARRRRPA